MTGGEHLGSPPSDAVGHGLHDIAAMEHELFGLAGVEQGEGEIPVGEENHLGIDDVRAVRLAIANAWEGGEEAAEPGVYTLSEASQEHYRQLVTSYVDRLVDEDNPLSGRALSRATLVTGILRNGMSIGVGAQRLGLDDSDLDPLLAVADSLLTAVSVVEGAYPTDEMGRRPTADQTDTARRGVTADNFRAASREAIAGVLGDEAETSGLLDRIAGRINSTLESQGLEPLPQASSRISAEEGSTSTHSAEAGPRWIGFQDIQGIRDRVADQLLRLERDSESGVNLSPELREEYGSDLSIYIGAIARGSLENQGLSRAMAFTNSLRNGVDTPDGQRLAISPDDPLMVKIQVADGLVSAIALLEDATYPSRSGDREGTRMAPEERVQTVRRRIIEADEVLARHSDLFGPLTARYLAKVMDRANANPLMAGQEPLRPT